MDPPESELPIQHENMEVPFLVELRKKYPGVDLDNTTVGHFLRTHGNDFIHFIGGQFGEQGIKSVHNADMNTNLTGWISIWVRFKFSTQPRCWRL